MAKTSDPQFEMRFFESVLRRAPDYTEVIEILGGLYTKHGRVADGLRMDRKLVKLLPDNSTAHYNLACSLALSKRHREALQTLRRAVELGYKDADWMLQDPDLDGLKQHPGFIGVLEAMKSQA